MGSADEAGGLGRAMHRLVSELYPICRSLTGDGVRQTLRILREHLPLEIREVPSGTKVFDWSVPAEWNIRDAWIKNVKGERVVDFRRSNLHVVGYSIPVRMTVPLKELKRHLYTLPEHPQWIPYRTAYYEEDWGFSVSQEQLEALDDAEYEVCIEASLAPGHLSFGECLLPGQIEDEVLISTHVCHPSLCNDNLSGIVVSAFLAQWLQTAKRRLSYRLLYVPGTIGSITWLALNRDNLKRIKHGLTLVCLGDSSHFTYKRSWQGTSEIDRAAVHVLGHLGSEHEAIDFFPYGYDERQFNAPGFRLPVGSLMRGRHGEFPEYHSSADDLHFVRPEQLEASLHAVCSIVEVLEGNRVYRNLSPYGEPQLGKRGIYRAMGAGMPGDMQLAMFWVLNLSDGAHSLLSIAERSGLGFGVVRRAAELLAEHGLLEEVPGTQRTRNA